MMAQQLQLSLYHANGDTAFGPFYTYTIIDDDIAWVTVTPIDTITGEDGDTGSFSVVLNTEPIGNVFLSFVSSNILEWTVPAGSAVFDNTNWNIAQNISVTGIDDTPAADDGTINYNIAIDVNDATTTAPEYDALVDADVVDVAMQNQNNDAPWVVVDITDGITDETWGTASINFTLLSAPTADVVIPLDITGWTDEISLWASSVTLNATNWNTGVSVIVTGVDDNIIDGDIAASVVTGTITSTDTSYGGMVGTTIADAIIINSDDDVLDVQFTTSSASDGENVGANLPELVTSWATSLLWAGMTVDVVVTGTAQALLDSWLTATGFTVNIPSGAHPQTIAIPGLTITDDMIDEENETLIFTISNPSEIYGNIGATNTHTYTITDDDTADVLITAVSDNLTDEDGDTLTFDVTLATEPTGDVVITVVSSDTGEAIVDSATLTFTSANWNIAQTVTVTGVDDVLSDGAQSFDIDLDIDTWATTDTNYDTLTWVWLPWWVNGITGQNQDNDAPGIVVTLTDTDTGEDGSTATINFKLLAATGDGSDVTIALSSSDTGEGTVPATVVISNTWSTTTGQTMYLPLLLEQ